MTLPFACTAAREVQPDTILVAVGSDPEASMTTIRWVLTNLRKPNDLITLLYIVSRVPVEGKKWVKVSRARLDGLGEHIRNVIQPYLHQLRTICENLFVTGPTPSYLFAMKIIPHVDIKIAINNDKGGGIVEHMKLQETTKLVLSTPVTFMSHSSHLLFGSSNQPTWSLGHSVAHCIKYRSRTTSIYVLQNDQLLYHKGACCHKETVLKQLAGDTSREDNALMVVHNLQVPAKQTKRLSPHATCLSPSHLEEGIGTVAQPLWGKSLTSKSSTLERPPHPSLSSGVTATLATVSLSNLANTTSKSCQRLPPYSLSSEVTVSLAGSEESGSASIRRDVNMEGPRDELWYTLRRSIDTRQSIEMRHSKALVSCR
eukprot:SM000022S07165  [mRNA]  locus=s22:298539:300532:+ [translate_table: standard]